MDYAMEIGLTKEWKYSLIMKEPTIYEKSKKLPLGFLSKSSKMCVSLLFITNLLWRQSFCSKSKSSVICINLSLQATLLSLVLNNAEIVLFKHYQFLWFHCKKKRKKKKNKNKKNKQTNIFSISCSVCGISFKIC